MIFSRPVPRQLARLHRPGVNVIKLITSVIYEYP
jgi:hypothetical protein